MVRATAAEVEDLLGTYPAGWNATNVAEVCNSAFIKLNAWVKKYYDTDISGNTDDDWTDIENELVVNMIHRANKVHENADILPLLFTQELKDLIDAAMTDTTFDGASTLNLSKGRNE